jgi:putative DNA primase/helicase
LHKFDPNMPLTPSDTDMQRYFASLGYHKSIVDSVKVAKGAIAPNPFATVKPGEKVKEPFVEVYHLPVTKCRIIFPLASPVEFSEDWKEAAETENDWRAQYHHVGTGFGFQFDASGADLNRAFYSARQRPGTSYRAVFGGAAALVLPPVTEEMRKAVGGVDPEKRKVALAARRATRGGDSKVAGLPDTADFMWRHGDAFDVLGWIADIGLETRGEPKRSGRGLKQTIRCPNERQHSPTPGVDMGCVAVMPDSGYGSAAKIMCQHDHCAFNTADFLEMVCEEILTSDNELPELENYVFVEVESSSANDNQSANRLDFTKLNALLKSTPYALKNGWIEYAARDEETGKMLKPQRVCKAFEPLDMTHAENDGEWSVRIRFADFNGKLITASILIGEVLKERSDLRSTLNNLGLDISLSKTGFNGLFALLKRVKERAVVVRKPGWRDDNTTFVTPSGETIRAKKSNYVATAILDRHATRQQGGLLSGQKEAWAFAFKHGGDHHFLGCLGGVAGVIVQYAELDSSPTVGLTGKSSQGKSTALKLAAGGFGWPKLLKKDASRGGLFHSLRATDNSVEYLAERSTGTFLGLDETKHFKDPKKLQELIFMLAEGSGKNRSKADASQRETRYWSTFVMLTSEIAISKVIEAAGEQALVGFTARFADINVDGYESMSDANYKKLDKLLSRNYGWIGPEFVRYVVECGMSPEDVSTAIDSKVQVLVGGEKEASALVSRSANVFALLWQVGEMLEAAGLLGEGTGCGGRIRKIWASYRLSEVAAVLDPTQSAIETLRHALRTRIGVDVHPTSGNEDKKSRASVAWYVPLEVGAFPETPPPPVEFYVPKDELVKLAGGTVGVGPLREALEAAGILKRPEKKKQVYHQWVPKVGAVNAYRLIFGGEESP